MPYCLIPIKAPYNSYEGGGYAAVLGYDEATAHGVLSETLGHGWVDRQTRAIILEFAVFNANTNLLSISTYFYEMIATGAAYTAKRIDTLELYSTESGALMFYLICQFLFMAMVLFNFIMMLIHLYRQRLGFFKSVWNMVDFLMIVFPFSYERSDYKPACPGSYVRYCESNCAKEALSCVGGQGAWGRNCRDIGGRGGVREGE